jgi:8-oxo-dGTP diphosphatase
MNDMSSVPDVSTQPGGMTGSKPVLAVADAFVTDQQGRLLLTVPSYRPDWVPPGGDVEAGEDPKAACSREVFEELGLVVVPQRLLVLDWLPPHQFRSCPMVYFLFDCDEIAAGSRIRRNAGEVREHAFVPLEHAATLTNSATMRRLTAAARAKSEGITIYLPDLE